MTFFSLPLFFLLLYLFEIITLWNKRKNKESFKKVIFQYELINNNKFLMSAIAFVLLLPVLNGCMFVVAGGAGAEGGYIATKKGQTAGEVIDDQWITTKIKAKMIADPDVKALQINVDTENGVVALTGSVNSQEEMEKVVAIIKNTKGMNKNLSIL